MKVVDVAVLGASGYAARELFLLLLRHPGVRVTAATSREEDRPAIGAVHPILRGRLDLRCEPFDPDAVAGRAQAAFAALPHGASIPAVAALVERGLRVVDLSADYRLRNPDEYSKWYGAAHADRGNLARAVYGLTELYGDQVAVANLVANPGCYPTSAILPLAPLLAGGWVEPEGIVIDSKSGVSGGGREPKKAFHFPECNEAVSAYNLGTHRHTPEIEQALADAAGKAVPVIFSPHLIPMDRGILSTIYARPARAADAGELRDALAAFYAGKPFVRVGETLPSTKDVVGTNFCDVAVRCVRDRVVVVSCIDNLIKGAAGAAVQNFNRMFGFPETTGLL